MDVLRNLIAIGIGVAWLAFAAIVVLNPPAPTPPIRSQVPQSQPESQNQEPTDHRRSVSNEQPQSSPDQPTTPQQNQTTPGWTIDSNQVIAFLTLVLAVVAFLQWRTHVETLTANQTIERAYVTMSHKPPGLDGFEDPSDKLPDDRMLDIQLVVKVKNYGSTPATVTYILCHPVWATLPDQPPYDEQCGERVRVTLVRDQLFNFTTKFQVPVPMVRSVFHDGLKLFVIGYVDYIDQFGGRHRSGYGRVYTPKSDNVFDYRFSTSNGSLDRDRWENRNNLHFITQAGYNYDRPRQPGEGNDWDDPPE